MKKYSDELWNKWVAKREPKNTANEGAPFRVKHLEAFRKFITTAMVKGRYADKLKIFYELLYRYQETYETVIYEEDIRKFKSKLDRCTSWREQYERFMFIPNATDPMPQYLGVVLYEP